MNLKSLWNRKFALFIEKASFQLMGVIFIFLLFKVTVETVAISISWLVISEILSQVHPRTRTDESVSMFLSGFLLVYLATFPQTFSLHIALKGLGVFLLSIGAIRNIWKISAHVAGISFLASLASIFGSVFLSAFSFLILPVVTWSRLRLKRHNTLQVVAGFVFGLVLPVLII